MKTMTFGTMLLLLTLLSLPATSDAFSRRSSGSEIGPMQATTAPVTTQNADAQAVPEPPLLILMSIGLGVFGLGYAMFRKES